MGGDGKRGEGGIMAFGRERVGGRLEISPPRSFLKVGAYDIVNGQTQHSFSVVRDVIQH